MLEPELQELSFLDALSDFDFYVCGGIMKEYKYILVCFWIPNFSQLLHFSQ